MIGTEGRYTRTKALATNHPNAIENSKFQLPITLLVIKLPPLPLYATTSVPEPNRVPYKLHAPHRPIKVDTDHPPKKKKNKILWPTIPDYHCRAVPKRRNAEGPSRGPIYPRIY